MATCGVQTHHRAHVYGPPAVGTYRRDAADALRRESAKKNEAGRLGDALWQPSSARARGLAKTPARAAAAAPQTPPKPSPLARRRERASAARPEMPPLPRALRTPPLDARSPPQPLTRLSKNRKKRGHVSAGHGRVGKHRKHPGGRGNAGGQHHMRTLFDKFHPGYFGKVGMRHFHVLKNRAHCPIINLDMLWPSLPEGTLESVPEGKAPVIDVTKSGFAKVCGKGRLPKQPVVVKAKMFTKMAERKIKACGGACILV